MSDTITNIIFGTLTTCIGLLAIWQSRVAWRNYRRTSLDQVNRHRSGELNRKSLWSHPPVKTQHWLRKHVLHPDLELGPRRDPSCDSEAFQLDSITRGEDLCVNPWADAVLGPRSEVEPDGHEIQID